MAAPTKAPVQTDKKIPIRILSTYAKVDGVRVTRDQIVDASPVEAARLVNMHEQYYAKTGNPGHGAVRAGTAVPVPSNLSATDLPLTGGSDFANDPDDETAAR